MTRCQHEHGVITTEAKDGAAVLYIVAKIRCLKCKRRFPDVTLSVPYAGTLPEAAIRSAISKVVQHFREIN